MEYFVTGATGFLGSRLVAQLVEAGHDVIALARSPAAAEGALPDGVRVVEGDITRRESMRDAMAGVDGVFHLAAVYEVGVLDPARLERVNVEGTRNVLSLMADLDVPRGVYTSSLAVFSDTGGRVPDESYRVTGRHLSAYDRTKWAAHYEVAAPMMADGLPLITLLPGVVYGPGDRGPMWELWRAYLDGDLPVIPRRSGYCWGHVDDTVRAHVAAMERGEPGEDYIVAGSPHTLVEVMAMAERATGIDAPRSVPPGVFTALSRLAAPFDRVLPRRYRAESLRVLGGATYYGDNAKATRELGLEHRPVEEGLAATLRAERQSLDDE